MNEASCVRCRRTKDRCFCRQSAVRLHLCLMICETCPHWGQTRRGHIGCRIILKTCETCDRLLRGEGCFDNPPRFTQEKRPPRS